MNILVTGGAGYIGSHFVKVLRRTDNRIVVLDNLSRGHTESVPDGVSLEKIDLLDFTSLTDLFSRHSIDAIVHFAAFAYVGESVDSPDIYYRNNVLGSYNLIEAAKQGGVKKFVFSSTCSLYGNPDQMPIKEDFKTDPLNPYARTKLMIEQVLRDYDTAFGIKSVCLRYFNAAGASFDGDIGESHHPEPHLIPIILNTALGKRESVTIYGDDYPTDDGTCIRDYIHILDLADAHLRALNYLVEGKDSTIINLGTGYGNSVLEVIRKCGEITGKKINYKIGERRAGDPAILVADNHKARTVLGWIPKFGIEQTIESAWKWHLNPRY
ncbi:MAG: UDP-glucose 4-epimerase GalE [Ignavibacteriaceae bacterium]|nr:UDP-glucose 4-epimerase GalE [Ignavibacteriaceae bacterium]